MPRMISTLTLIVLATLSGCSDREHSAGTRSGVKLLLHADQTHITRTDELVRHATSVVVGRPVGESLSLPVDMSGSEPVFANIFRDLAISRTIYGPESGVIRIVTVGWNQDSKLVASGNVEFEGKPIPMLGEVPEGEAIFFLKRFPDIPELGSLAGAYEVVGQDVGRVPLNEASSFTGSVDDMWTSKMGVAAPELAGRDLRSLAQELQTARDAFEASEICELVAASVCPEGEGISYVKSVQTRTRPDGGLEQVRECCRYPYPR